MRNNPSPQVMVRRGQIWLVDWEGGRGSEQQGRRPAVIVQTDGANRSVGYPNTIVVAISSKGKPVPTHVHIRPSTQNGLKRESFVKCEQLLTISKWRLIGKPWGHLDDVDIDRINHALKLTLALH